MKRETYLDLVRTPKKTRPYNSASKEKSLEYWHSAQALSQKTAHRKWKPWSTSEELLISQGTATDVELAQRLQRSMAAVRTKRKKLNTRARNAAIRAAAAIGSSGEREGETK